MVTKKFISTSSLMLAMFFLPLGYDALFRLLMNLTGSYWTADIIFYAISSSFFITHFWVEGVIQKTYRKLMQLILFTKSPSTEGTARRKKR